MHPVLENYMSSPDSQLDSLYILEYAALGCISVPQSDAKKAEADDDKQQSAEDEESAVPSERHQLSVKDLIKVIHHLYNEDILVEEAIIRWFGKPSELSQIVSAPAPIRITREQQKELRTNQLLQRFIEWLNQDSSDEDEEDEEDDEEDGAEEDETDEEEEDD